jgi:hypothetical protein
MAIVMSSNMRGARTDNRQVPSPMSTAVHRRHAAVVLAAFVVAAAFPMTLVLSRDGSDSPDEVVVTTVVTKVMTDAEAAAVVPLAPFTEDSDRTDAAAQAASMLFVGSLLIGIGTVVRRVV